MVLNKKQKQFLFSHVMSNKEKEKLFETTNINWLTKQKVKLGEDDGRGWRDLIVDNELVTQLNFNGRNGCIEIIEHIDDYEQCQWCEEWFLKEEIIHRRKGFTKLCEQCNSYLISREGEV